MSEYNIQMNRYNALNAEYDQLYPATKIENVNGLDTALQNKADLGEDGKVPESQLPSMGYSKSETLSDTTKALFGLDATAVPDDAFNVLSRFHKGLGNEYVWAKSNSTGVVGYVNSPDPNAYPPAVSDGYTYTALGQIGRLLNHVGTVSYTGTGVSSVTVLTEFKAKFAIICSKSVISSRWRIAFAVGNYGGFQVGIADINNSDSGLYRVTSSMTDASITITSPYDTSAINESSKAYLLTYFG